MSQKESAVMETTYLLRKKPRNSENEKDIDSKELHKTMEEELRQRLNQKVVPRYAFCVQNSTSRSP
jgi:hypothetical protein